MKGDKGQRATKLSRVGRISRGSNLPNTFLVLEVTESSARLNKGKPESSAKQLEFICRSSSKFLEDFYGTVECVRDQYFVVSFADTKNCLEAANAIRRFVSEENTNRVVSGKTMIRTKIALSTNPLGAVPSLTASLSILNWAKIHHIEMACNQAFRQQISNVDFVRPLDVLTQAEDKSDFVVYELFSHASKSVRDYKMETKNRTEQLILFKQQHDNASALKILDLMIKTCPTHTYLNGEIMDPSLHALRSSILDQLKASEFQKAS